MQRNLSFSQTPQISVPFRFFLTAPLFAFTAALVVLWHGPEALVSRWSPVTLVLTHLLTLGFLAMSMIDALIQILPVVANVNIPHARLTASMVHVLLAGGTATLAVGFTWSSPLFYQLALPLLVSGLAWLIAAAGYGIWHAPGVSATLAAIRLALSSLFITITIGSMLVSAIVWGFPFSLIEFANLHALWGLLGWIGLLVIGVSFQVVPMFQVTPLYPRFVTRWLPGSLFFFLIGWTASAITLHDQFSRWGLAAFTLIAASFLIFSLTTLYLLWRQKRAKKDASTLFWRTSMCSLAACAAVWVMGTIVPHAYDNNSYPLVLGILFIIGFAYSVVNGMLYKIVPFLVWYHLQNQLTGGCGKVPNVRKILPDSDMEKQFWVHLTALILMLGAALLPTYLTYPAALLFGTSSCWLWWNLAKATHIYRKALRNQSVLSQAIKPSA